MREEPCVSVVIPVYNPGKGIRRCIAMVQRQTLSDIEILFIDDRGTDDSMEAVRRAARGDRRIRIITNPENLGPGASRNRGIEAARGTYISFIDADDYPGRDFLELLYRRAKACDEDPDVVKGERRLTGPDGRAVREPDRIAYNTRIRVGLGLGGKLYELFSYHHWTAIYRRQFLLGSGIRYGTTRNSQDTTFLLRVGKAARTICFEDRALYCYTTGASSRMRDCSRYRLENELEAFRDQMEEMKTCDPADGSFYHYIIGKIKYLLRLQAHIRLQNEEDGKWFLRRLHSAVNELPWKTRIAGMDQTLRAFLIYGANLSILPYRAREDTCGIDAYMDAIMRTAAFLEKYPEERAEYAWMPGSAYRTLLLGADFRRLDAGEREELCTKLRQWAARPEVHVSAGKSGLPARYFTAAWVNLFLLFSGLRIHGRKLLLQAAAGLLPVFMKGGAIQTDSAPCRLRFRLARSLRQYRIRFRT